MSPAMIDDGHPNGHDAAFLGPEDSLSESGRARRDAMLPDLQTAVVREGRRRQMRRSVARGAGTVLLAALIGVGVSYYWPASDSRHLADRRSTAQPPDHAFKDFSIVRDKPGVLDRLAIKTNVQLGDYVVDDHQLVATLAAIGRPAGLVRSPTGIRFTAPVTDAQLTPNGS